MQGGIDLATATFFGLLQAVGLMGTTGARTDERNPADTCRRRNLHDPFRRKLVVDSAGPHALEKPGRSNRRHNLSFELWEVK